MNIIIALGGGIHTLLHRIFRTWSFFLFLIPIFIMSLDKAHIIHDLALSSTSSSFSSVQMNPGKKWQNL